MTLVDTLSTALGAQFTDLRGLLPKHATDTYDVRPLGDIARVIVHHSASVQTTWINVARYHVNKNWPGVGYHFGIEPFGQTAYLGSIETIRWHAGNANGGSVGICFMGNFETDTPTSAALGSYARLLSGLESFLGRELLVLGHRDVGETACPGKNLYAVLFSPVTEQPEALPEDEVEARADVLAEKCRWWLEEAQRQDDAGNHARAQNIRYSLIKPDDGLLYRLEDLLGMVG